MTPRRALVLTAVWAVVALTVGLPRLRKVLRRPTVADVYEWERMR